MKWGNRIRRRRHCLRGLSIVLALLCATWLSAAPQVDGEEPGPGVARLSLANGDVTVRRGDSGEFVAGEPNAPLVVLDHVITGADGRAEIQFDWANMIRLAPDSEVRLAALDEGDFFLQLTGGMATFSVLRESSSLVEISTATASVRPVGHGTYRIEVLPDGSVEITVRSGEAEIFSARGSEFLQAGRTMQVRGNPDNPDIIVLASIPRDDWDRWNEARDRDLEASDSYRYVSRDVYGADDLAGHGRWVYDPPYGWVWAPYVTGNWAPYRIGRWSWISHYGWTWISNDPWGWAPYHYGRWYYAPAYGWVWYPGAVGLRHYWSPGLVAFFGWGSPGVRVSVSFGFGFGRVGWVPLAPNEVYRPWYGRRDTTNVTVNNTTIVNNIDIDGTYRNARVVNGRRGITSVTTENFGRKGVTLDDYVRVSDGDLRRAGEVRGRVPVAPSAESRQFSDRPARPPVGRSERADNEFALRRTGSDGGANGPVFNPNNGRAAGAIRATERRAEPQSPAATARPDTPRRSNTTPQVLRSAPERSDPQPNPNNGRAAGTIRAAERRAEPQSPAASARGDASRQRSAPEANRGRSDSGGDQRIAGQTATRSPQREAPEASNQRTGPAPRAPSNGATRSAPEARSTPDAGAASSPSRNGRQNGRAQNEAPSDDSGNASGQGRGRGR